MPVSKHIESTNRPNNVPNSKRSKGTQAESEACAYLEGLGFEIIERNFFARYGEIDIIAKRANLLHFIEVKSGVGFEPMFNITPSKIAKLQKAMRIYLAKHPSKLPYCLDALIVRYGKSVEFELLENITQG